MEKKEAIFTLYLSFSYCLCLKSPHTDSVAIMKNTGLKKESYKTGRKLTGINDYIHMLKKIMQR